MFNQERSVVVFVLTGETLALNATYTFIENQCKILIKCKALIWLESTHLATGVLQRTSFQKNTSCKLSPVKHFNYMPTKFSFNEMRL